LFVASITNQLRVPNAEVFEGSFPLRKDGYGGPVTKVENNERVNHARPVQNSLLTHNW